MDTSFASRTATSHSVTRSCVRRRTTRCGRRTAVARTEHWPWRPLRAGRWKAARGISQQTGERIRRRTDADASRLTPQELQIALTVVRGATNKQAAAQLFLSPKTIEKHLGSVYGKLGVRSRTELAAVFASTHVADTVPAPA